MDYEYLTKIRNRLALYTRKKTSNLLEGDFRSVYRGRSMDFDDLREYTPGDNVRDIDWKSSSRTGKMLVRRYVAEKRHNILLVADAGVKMQGDTPGAEQKASVALTVLGVLAYLADRHGDDFALLHSSGSGLEFSWFRNGPIHFETLMQSYSKDAGRAARHTLPEVLAFAAEKIRRRMVIFVITDLDGLDSITEKLVRTLTVNNDLLAVCVDDAFLSESGGFNLDSGRYEDPLVAGNRRLREAEQNARQAALHRAEELFRRYRVPLVRTASAEETVDRMAELLEQTREAQK